MHNVATVNFLDKEFLYDIDSNSIYIASDNIEINEDIFIKDKPNNDLKKSLKNQNYTVINIIPTHKCNLECSYCYAEFAREKTGAKDTLSVKMLENGLDKILERQESLAAIKFTGGGEPLLDVTLFKNYVNMIKKKYKGIFSTIEVSTNGTNVDSSFIDFIIEHDLLLKCSYDGSSLVNKVNRGRNDSFLLRIINNNQFHKFKENITIAITITSNNLNIFNYILNLYNAGFKRVRFQLALHKDLIVKEDSFHILKVQIEKLFEWYLDIKRKKNDFIIDNIDDHVFQIKNDLYYLLHNTTCRAGINEISINPSGDFFTCPRMTDYDDSFKIGSISSGINNNQINKIIDIMSIDEKEDCKKCWLGRICKGLCNFALKTLTDSYQKVDNNRCNYLKLMYSGAIWFIFMSKGEDLFGNNDRKYR